MTQKVLNYADIEKLPGALEIIDIINSGKLSKNKNIYDENYDFIVSTNQAVMITNGNYHSLTFHVYRLVDNGLTENLVLSWYNGKYYPALYIYDFNAEEKQKVKNNIPFLITKKIERKLLENFDVGTVVKGIICTTTTTSITVDCSEDKHGAYNFGKWPECTAEVRPLQIVISSTDCNETWVNGGVYYIANPGSGGGGGGNPNYNPNMPPYNPGNGVPIALGHITRPFLSLVTPEQTFYNQLSQDQKGAMNIKSIRAGILKVLQLNNYSPASQQLAEDVCDFYIETGNTSLANKILTLAKTDVESAQQIIDYLSNEGNSEASQTIVMNLVTAMQNTGLIFDVEKSAASPCNIDMTAVSGNSPEEIRFNSVYSKLMASTLFKQMLASIFEDSSRYNIKFKIGNLSGNNNGETRPIQITTNNV